MRAVRGRLLLGALSWLMAAGLLACEAPAAEPFRYPEGRSGAAELRYIGGLPVLTLQGSPAEMGRQQGALGRAVTARIAAYPREFLKTIRHEDRFGKFVALGRALAANFPPDHLAELDALSRSAGVERDLLLVANTMADTYRDGFGCSSLLVDARRSKTGGPLFGRNLDFFTLGTLQDFSLVIVCKPEGKRAFASVGFPGFVGCLSGMNDAGLALAVHEVPATRDGSKLLDPKGTPYALIFRRILEECATVDEADKLLRACRRTTLLNLAVCDPKTHAVLEMTPRSVVRRADESGVTACTNHFRSDPLRFVAICPRYEKLIRVRSLERIGLADVADRLHAANQDRMTLQTMIFEPAKMRLHLAIGKCPTSALPLNKLDLAGLLGVTR